MLSAGDVALVREHGCTVQATRSQPVQDRPGVFVTQRARPCAAPAIWVSEWIDRDRNDERVITPVLAAACQLHYEQIAGGGLPLLDSRHETVSAVWYRLPDDPSKDAAWVADMEEAKVDNP